MGKDQELLDAARCGNIGVVERFLNQRAKKTGPLANLRRGPGPNVQDASGYTPMHHAALNGHLDIVNLLLDHEGLSNIVDNKGCTPLHLSSWSGNTDIVQLILSHPSSVPSVNHMNFDHESALHSASQYGHTEIVKLLIQNNCYPSVRNIRNESPLDLASKYGRLETVKCLLSLHPESMNDFVRCHSPLHLASKNGHKAVVKTLLDAGFDVNFMTDVGTALHEAAMYGKIDVVKLLLDYGVDVTLENSRNRTVFDILRDLNTTIACQIEEIIRDHVTLIKLDSDSNDSVPAILPPYDFVSGSAIDPFPEKCSLSDISPPHQFCSSSPVENFYEIPPSPKIINWPSSGACDSLSSLPLSQDSSFDQTSCSSCSPAKYESTDSTACENNGSKGTNQENILYEVPPPPMLFSSKQFPDRSHPSALYENVPFCNSVECKDEVFDSYIIPNLQESYIPMMPAYNSNTRLQAPTKPPRKSLSPNAPNLTKDQLCFKSKDNCYEFLYLANSGSQQTSARNLDKSIKMLSYPNSKCRSEYVDMCVPDSAIGTYENHEVICSNGVSSVDKLQKDIPFNKFSEILPVQMRYENLQKLNSFNNFMSSKSTPALHASRHTLDHVIPLVNEKELPKPNCINLRPKRASIQIPTSPTNYQQPPTPDIPPPSPATAETGIHEKIRPINQEYRSRKSESRDIDTLTDEQLVATIGPSGEIQLILATDNKCVSTDSSEVSTDNPFEGLCKGSVARVSSQLPTPFNKLEYQGYSNRSKNIYENVEIIMEGGQRKIILPDSDGAFGQNNNQSSLSIMSPFDEKAEWAEIADIMATFGGVISRDTLPTHIMEASNFAQTFGSDSAAPLNKCKINSIEHWLAKLGLSQYENLLVINGFDDILFLGGNIIEDQDLAEIGIENSEHRQKIRLAAQSLPPLQSINKLSDNSTFPASVYEWLHSINLQEYVENFSNNNITDMERALKLWEVELNTVLKITKLGHRKRILASLGDKHFEHLPTSAEIDLAKLNVDLEELGIDDAPGNDNCAVMRPYNDADSYKYNGPFRQLQIRSPTQLMSESKPLNQDTKQTSIEAQWRHCPNDLIGSCCNYIAKYLGSTLVKELKGMESTKNSIQKFRSSSQTLGKIPNIILSISYTGVKFIDAESQQLVCEHEIRNIHCACQDADDLCHFAYITKDHQTHNHYCHVFCSNSVDLASEIILTLGQAFEVAYQIAVNEKSAKASHCIECHASKDDSSKSNSLHS